MANCEESAETKWKHVMDEHVAARVKQSNGGAKNASLYTHPSPVVIKPKYMAPMINSYLSVTEENFKTSIASFCVLIVYPDAWLEDARQGATPGQRAPQPLLKKRGLGLWGLGL